MRDRQFPIRFLGSLWSTLTSDPDTAVALLSSTGQTVWLNDATVRMLYPPGTTADRVVGEAWAQRFDPDWVAEILGLLEGVRADLQPRVLRTIWRGHQTFLWLHPVEADPPPESTHNGHPPPDPTHQTAPHPAPPAPDRFLLIARQISGDSNSALNRTSQPDTPDIKRFESALADLGELAVLTSRELEVLALLGQGMTAKEIAAVLHRSPKTVENHRNAIGQKLGVGDRVTLAAMARRAGLRTADAKLRRMKPVTR